MGVVMVMWLFKILPFAVMQRVTRVRQRQRSCLLSMITVLAAVL